MRDIFKTRQIRDFLKRSPIDRFFYNLLHAPKPKIESASDWEKICWLIKYFSGLYFFKLGYKYYRLMSYLTQYFPFSLLYQDRRFHAQNKPLTDFANAIEDLSQKNKLPIFTYLGQSLGPLYELGFIPLFNKPTEEKLKKLESILQDKYPNLYIRKREEEFIIIFSNEFLNSILQGDI